jgi:hypothetical protein
MRREGIDLECFRLALWGTCRTLDMAAPSRSRRRDGLVARYRRGGARMGLALA